MSSISEVARQAGVSTATVSRTFSTPDMLSLQTRRRVMEVADRLNYRPRAHGVGSERRLVRAAKSHDCLGFLFFAAFGDEGRINEFYTPVISGAQAEAARLGMHLLIGTTPRFEAPQTMPKMFRDDAVAGMMLIGAALPEVLHRFTLSSVPTVLVDNQADGADCIVSDGFGGGLAATKRLFELGHRRIAFVQNEPTAPSIQDRLRGFLCAHIEAGLPTDTALSTMICAEDAAEQEAMLIARLSASDRPTAVVAASDWNALTVLKACRAIGLAVPQDLSIVGFDDMPFSAHAASPLTTLRVDTEYMGRLAVRQLVRRIQESDTGAAPEPPVRLVVPVSLVLRESDQPLRP